MSKRIEHETCFYCDALVACNIERDHFPVPKRAGGTHTVRCCLSCHDMKDRFNVGDWPFSWVGRVISDLPKLSRETRIFLAKTLALCIASAKKNSPS